MGYKEDLSPEHAKEDEKAVYYSLKLMEQLEPEVFEKSIRELNGKIESKGRLYNYTNAKLGEIEPSTSKKLAESAVTAKGGTVAMADAELYELSKSMLVEDRIRAAILVRNLISDNNVFVLLDLLRDMSVRVKKEAIKTARKVKRPESWTILTELLSSKEFGNDAAAALQAGGDEALPVLELAFHKSSQSPEALSRIVKIMTRLKSEQAKEYLWDKLEYPDRKIVREILYGLQEAQFKVDQEKIGRVTLLLENEIGKAIWNLAAITEVKEKEHNNHLIGALNREVKSNFEFIYIYLSIIYDPASINLVKENIESGTSDGITYAMELLDVFISKELRAKLFPLIDDVPLEEKLEKLQVYYPRVSYNELQTLNYIINRDYNMINRWTKACALYSLSFQPKARINAGLTAHLFNPDILLAENAMMVIKKIDEQILNGLLVRIPEEKRYYLKGLMRTLNNPDEINDRFPYRFNRTLYLHSFEIFKELDAVHVSQIVDKIQIIKAFSGTEIKTDRIKGRHQLMIVESGKIELKGPDKVLTLRQDEFCGEFFLDHHTLQEFTLSAVEDSIVYFLDLSDFLLVLTNFRDKAKEVLEKIEENDLVKA